MQLQLSTWPEVEAYLGRSRGIILPIGSTEQHGPNGLIGTDAICAEAIGRGAAELAGAMVGPTIHVGMAEHHLAFSGTMSLRPSTLMLVLRDYVMSLSKHGFTRFFFLNGHGGNIATLRAAFYEIYAEARTTCGDNAPDIRCSQLSWWEPGVVARLARDMFGDKEGGHATPSEVSVTQYLHPDHIKRVPLDPETAPRGSFHDARDFRRRFPDGRIGSAPGLATPEFGKQLYETAVKAAAEVYQGFVAED